MPAAPFIWDINNSPGTPGTFTAVFARGGEPRGATVDGMAWNDPARGPVTGDTALGSVSALGQLQAQLPLDSSVPVLLSRAKICPQQTDLSAHQPLHPPHGCSPAPASASHSLQLCSPVPAPAPHPSSCAHLLHTHSSCAYLPRSLPHTCPAVPACAPIPAVPTGPTPPAVPVPVPP